MGLFSSITDTLFGGTDDSAQKATQKDNAARQAFVEQQTALSRGDANNLYNQSRGPLLAGYQGALDAIGGATKQQIDTTARGNYFGQEALLSGMPQFQNAILGRPVNNAALEPVILHPERNLDWMWNASPGQRSGGKDQTSHTKGQQEALAAYWAANPGSMEQAIARNPSAWGIRSPDQPASQLTLEQIFNSLYGGQS